MDDYQLIRRERARKIRITVHRGGTVTVTAPRHIPRFLVNAFVVKKSSWIAKAVARQRRQRPSVLPAASAAQFKKYKPHAYALIQERIAQLNQQYHFSFRSISIGNQKTLWGSCSKSGRLRFNYRIVFLPAALCDYIIVHELCHLKEMNHSQAFWQLVARTIKNPRRLRAQFRAQGWTLG